MSVTPRVWLAFAGILSGAACTLFAVSIRMKETFTWNSLPVADLGCCVRMVSLGFYIEHVYLNYVSLYVQVLQEMKICDFLQASSSSSDRMWVTWSHLVVTWSHLVELFLSVTTFSLFNY